MKNIHYLFLFILISGCRPSSRPAASEVVSLTVSNPLNQSRKNIFVNISVEDIRSSKPDFNPKAFYVMDKEAEIASEYDSDETDPLFDNIYVVLDSMRANETRTLTIYYNKEGTLDRSYTKRTYAELSHKTGGTWKDRVYEGGDFVNVDYLRVPPEHKDHSYFIRYEGPGWESDKVGYRFYLDQRNATDVFGKTTKDMALMSVGKDNFDSYHEMQPWGMDVMKVGRSLGLGSPGRWQDTTAIRIEKTDSITCKIDHNGTLRSSIQTNYYGWKTKADTVDVISDLSINAGSRLTYSAFQMGGSGENFCTGIVKDKTAKLFKSPGDKSAFGYIATWGKQSLNKDMLGLVVFFRTNDFVSFKEDYYSNVVTLRPIEGIVDYWFAAAWELEAGGITNEADFIKYVETTARELANPMHLAVK